MITANEEFWDFERAGYDDELDAWRERTAFTAGSDGNGHSAVRAMRPLSVIGLRPADAAAQRRARTVANPRAPRSDRDLRNRRARRDRRPTRAGDGDGMITTAA